MLYATENIVFSSIRDYDTAAVDKLTRDQWRIMIRITLLGAVLLFAGLGGNQTAIAETSVEVPIEVHEGHVYVNVVVNGSQPLSFLVDSGAAVSAELIDKGVAEKLGLQGEDERTTPAIGGNVRVSFSRPVTLRIGSLEIPPAKLALLS